MVGQHYETWEVLVDRSQSITNPTSSSWKPRQQETGRLQQRRRAVDPRFAHHVVNECDVIRDRAERCDGLAQQLATIAIRLKVPDRFHPRTKTILKRFYGLAEIAGCPVAFDEFTFVVKQIDVACRT